MVIYKQIFFVQVPLVLLFALWISLRFSSKSKNYGYLIGSSTLCYFVYSLKFLIFLQKVRISCLKNHLFMYTRCVLSNISHHFWYMINENKAFLSKKSRWNWLTKIFTRYQYLPGIYTSSTRGRHGRCENHSPHRMPDADWPRLYWALS